MANENPEIKLKDVRLSFSDNLFVAEAGEVRTKGKHKGKIPYRNSANFLIPKTNTVLIDAIKKVMIEARDQLWPKDPPKIKGDKLCLQDGDDVEYAGYADHMYISASRTTYGTDGKVPKRPFRIIGRNKVELADGKQGFPDINESDDIVYAGCYVNAVLRIWAQDDPDYGKRINASIEGVQFWRPGERFGGGKRLDVDNAFDEYQDDDDDGLGGGSASQDDEEEDLLA
jgi:hypothetical protein